MLCSWGATYTLADGVLYVCGNNEGQCLCVSRSDTRGGAAYALDDCILYGCGKSGAGTCVRRPDTHGMQPMPWLMACCTAVVTMKASVCVSANQMYWGCNLLPG